jgi:cystathionine gamma-synthase
MTNNSPEKAKPHFSTLSIWAGEEQKDGWKRSTQVPVVHSVSFGYDDLDVWYQVARGEEIGHIYGRNTNPTVDVFEEKIRQLEGAEAATSFSTGMAAISNALFALLKPGDRVVSVKDTYGGTNEVFTRFLPRFQVEVALCDTTDHEAIEHEISKGCQLLYLETPTNPTLKIIDLERLTKAGHAAGAVVIVDNTFATPINTNPIELGADLVVHSATKFLGGHADALGGVICGTEHLVEKIFRFREINGATLHPMSAYLLLRGMKTLDLRVKRQNENALKISRFLKSHPFIKDVYYPGLESHENHHIAVRQMRGFGGVLSFFLDGDFEAVKLFLPRLRFAHLAANLGAVETVAAPPRTSSHVEVSPEQRAALGIPESLIRFSVGIEDADDLCEDLSNALEYTLKNYAPAGRELGK